MAGFGALMPFRTGAAIRTGLLTLMLLAVVLLAPLCALAQTFPALSGRVVDAANVLGAEQRASLEAKLKAYEDKTSDQVVVATVPSLEGSAIEDYANRLFRHWRLGQEGKDNGVLLLVAPNERKVRIEVGYGLEGALTDALSKVIIVTAVAPQFQRGDFAAGVNAGLDAILSILTGDAEEWQRRAEIREDESTPVDFVFMLIMLFVLVTMIRRIMAGGGPRRAHRTRRGGWVAMPGPVWGGGWSGGFGGGGRGGFSGGGGSSGGGGASGSW
jgi:uncharacterized protein